MITTPGGGTGGGGTVGPMLIINFIVSSAIGLSSNSFAQLVGGGSGTSYDSTLPHISLAGDSEIVLDSQLIGGGSSGGTYILLKNDSVVEGGRTGIVWDRPRKGIKGTVAGGGTFPA